MALLTARDREFYRLRREIEQHQRWLADSTGDRRATAFHKARISELLIEIDRLEDQQ